MNNTRACCVSNKPFHKHSSVNEKEKSGNEGNLPHLLPLKEGSEGNTPHLDFSLYFLHQHTRDTVQSMQNKIAEVMVALMCFY